MALSIYRDKPWAKTLFQEYHDIEALEFDQYVGWKTRVYRGQFININQDGTRKTFNPTAADNEKGDSIYVFGGSSIWGVGVRDEYTIPSYLSKLLMQSNYHFVVKNYGERGYTFTQEIVRLTLLLRAGHRPCVVIFYDGVNDVISAYRYGRAGIIGLTSELKLLWEWWQLSPIKKIGSMTGEFIANHSMLYKAGDKLLSRLVYSRPSPYIAATYNEPELERLVKDISDEYLVSLHLVQKLSQAYGFQYFCFWQPVIFTKSPVTEEEKRLIRWQAINYWTNFTATLMPK